MPVDPDTCIVGVHRDCLLAWANAAAAEERLRQNRLRAAEQRPWKVAGFALMSAFLGGAWVVAAGSEAAFGVIGSVSGTAVGVPADREWTNRTHGL